jgi:hypothetical protein
VFSNPSFHQQQQPAGHVTVMKTKLVTAIVIASAAFVVSGAYAQDAITPPSGPGAGAIRELRLQFRQERAATMEEFIQARRELRQRLVNATEEERKAMVGEFRALYKERIEAERELRRELRTEIREIRKERRNLAPGG